jgi:glycosyltransferase involved in cell wall biosynthesis
MIEPHIAHVTCHISRLGGGLFESVRHLSQVTQENGIQVEVLGLEDQFSQEDMGRWAPLPVHVFPVQGPPRFGFAPELDGYLAGSGTGIVHLHGVWQYPTSSVLRWARATGRPYVVSAHGMLEPWALNRSRFKKAAVNWLYQNAMLREANCLRATAASEVETYRRLGLKNPIALIGNGVAVPEALQRTEDGGRTSDVCLPSSGLPISGLRSPISGAVGGSARRRALFISRVHPKKGLLDLVRAWAAVQTPDARRQTSDARSPSSDWELVIMGPDEGGHLAQVMGLVRELGLQEQIRYGGEVWQDDAKWRCYQEADLFVLPSYSENFGLVIAEALGCGVPVITTRATPWQELETHRCGWWIDPGKEPLAQALRRAMAVPVEELQAMGRRGRQLVLDKYSWAPIGRQMAETYEWLAGRRDRPEFVQIKS